jgi:sigma-B regulation protein RsbU (phosphoserine phosphatase)
MPKVGGLAVAARYEPMTAVAGDFYDFLEMGQSRLGVLVADDARPSSSPATRAP